jgi:hypothetical protein
MVTSTIDENDDPIGRPARRTLLEDPVDFRTCPGRIAHCPAPVRCATRWALHQFCAEPMDNQPCLMGTVRVASEIGRSPIDQRKRKDE